jgi:hypothetical protein
MEWSGHYPSAPVLCNKRSVPCRSALHLIGDFTRTVAAKIRVYMAHCLVADAAGHDVLK